MTVQTYTKNMIYAAGRLYKDDFASQKPRESQIFYVSLHRHKCRSLPELTCQYTLLYIQTPRTKMTDYMKENGANAHRKTSLLFVCLGNICRSPAAEGIMRHMVKENMMDDYVEIDSAGIGSWHAGELPDRRMRSHGAAHGYDFCSRARQIRQEDLQRFDRIIVMDEDNYSAVTAMARNDGQRRKVTLMTDYCRHHSGHNTVPDPYYGGDRGFELVIELLEDACRGLLEQIAKEHGVEYLL